MYKEFESERLLIRPTSEQDAEFIYQLLNTPKFIKYVGDRALHSIEDAKKYIQVKIHPQLIELGYSNYSLITKADNTKIGVCGLYNRAGVDGIDIGFALLPQYEGLGYAFESSNILIKAGFEEFKIDEIKAITSKGNISSKKLLERLGFDMVGTTKLPDEDEEILLYVKKRTSIKNQ